MSKVVIKECSSYDCAGLIETINSGMELLGGWERFVKPGMKVLLKVNLIGPKPPESAAVTHCEFVRAVTRILNAMGCTVWIGDSAGGAIAGMSPTALSFEISGMNKVASQENALIKNFDTEGTVETQVKCSCLDKLYLAKPVLDADLVINLPKFKTHSAAIFTGAVKNVFGCIQGLRKAQYHKAAPVMKEFGKVLADIHEAAAFGLHIMDGVTAMEGLGPTAGSVYKANKILLSTDPLALDAVAMKMIGQDIKSAPVMQAAVERGIGESELERIEVCGDYDKPPVLPGFKVPKVIANMRSNGKIFVKVIDLMKARPAIDMKECRQCNMCVDSCPVQAIDRETKNIDYSKCIECLCCHELCRYKAVELRRNNALGRILFKMTGTKRNRR
ncbi:MAG: DUF362 domain-containing protein [Clostridiales bacterium]|jgi:uncharacterized protein (DUF362 family)/ferredoxin-like protein FixX|nr:DUF362 domain-containing protein [Clostridiales bacterium]